MGIVRNSHIYDPVADDWTNTAPLNEPPRHAGPSRRTASMVTLPASPTSYVADPRVCGAPLREGDVAGNSVTGTTELFTAAGTCYGFNATITAEAGGGDVAGTDGRDVIIGLAGTERIAGGGGDDIICGGGGDDQTTGGGCGDVVLAGDGLDRVSGGEGDGFLFGEVAADQLSGGRGVDTADGWTESDACGRGPQEMPVAAGDRADVSQRAVSHLSGTGSRSSRRHPSEKEASMAAEQTCPRCGMEQNVWKGNGGQGVEKDGATYCCQDCADGTGCICG